MMNHLFKGLLIAVFFVFFLSTPSSAFAQENHTWQRLLYSPIGRCPNPGGSLRVAYDEGWHWIVGNSQLQWGSDKVYDLGDNAFIQCYCPIAHEGFSPAYQTGIQTVWIPVSILPENIVSQMLNKGWQRVENGADFGLPAIPYLAQNLPFNCGEGGCVTSVIQNNSASVSNSIVSNVQTGGNTISNSTGESATVTTGNAQNSVSVSNTLNLNKVVGCTSGCSTGPLSVSIRDNGAGSVNEVTVGFRRLESLSR